MDNKRNIVDEKGTAGSNTSFWLDSYQTNQPAQSVRRMPLTEDLQTEVVVVGGGMAGVSVAYNLSRAGKKVVLVEDGLLCSGETGRTTAHLVTALDDRYYDLQKIFSEEELRLIADSHQSAIDFIENTVKLYGIDCDFERLNGYLFLHPSDKADSLEKELDAAQLAGLDVGFASEVPGMLQSQGRCIQFRNQAQFHPVKYILALCKVIEKNGGRIFTETHASEINAEGIVTQDGKRITADFVVVATNTPVNNLVSMHLKQYAYRTYVIGALVPKGMLPKALWWDTGDQAKTVNPYHYVRLHTYSHSHDLLIGGGEDHSVGDTSDDHIPEEKRYELLEAWIRERFPIEGIVYRWSGQVMEPFDSLAYIGRNPWDKDNIFIVTGDSGNGMTHGTIAGMLIADQILGVKNEWEDIYSPSRMKLKKVGTLVKELTGSLVSALKNLPAEAEGNELLDLQIGEGKIIHVQGKKCAASRDDHGNLHIVSAQCTHLKAILHWNRDEHTWDCPWHGSRFSCEGHVINGPANTNLEKAT